MSNNVALERLVTLGSSLFSKRAGVVSLWQELSDIYYPERGQFTRTFSDGESFADHLYDSAPAMFRRDLGNNISSVLRPPGSPWFKVGTGNPAIDKKIANRRWLDNATTVLRRHHYHAKSGTTRALKEADHDFVTFGNAAISIRSRPGKQHLTSRCHHLNDTVWLENDDGEVTHVQHRRDMYVRDVIARWGQKVPKALRDAYEKDPACKVLTRNIACQADEYFDFDGADKPQARTDYVSIWCLPEHISAGPMEVTPLQELIYLVPRWHTLSGSQYAVSPAAVVSLPDARMLQDMKRVVIEAGEKAVDPPLIATEEVVQGAVNLYAGGITWVDADYDERMGAALRALELGKNPGLGIDMIREVRASLGDGWFVNKLTLPADGEMTAYEAQQRIKEYVRAALPIFEPFGAGYSAPVLDLEFKLLLRMGAFGPTDEIPQDLRGNETEYELQTPLQEAEGRAHVQAFRETVELVTAGASLDETVPRNVDLNKATRDAVIGTGARADWLVDEKVLEEEDAAAAEEAAAGDGQMTPQDLLGMAPAIAEGAKGAKGAVDIMGAVKKMGL